MENLKNVRYNANYWKGITFTEYPMKEDPNAPFGQSADLFGDGSVIVYLAPSHSAGSLWLYSDSGERNRRQGEEDRRMELSKLSRCEDG